jgi:hypothetical protein
LWYLDESEATAEELLRIHTPGKAMPLTEGYSSNDRFPLFGRPIPRQPQ